MKKLFSFLVVGFFFLAPQTYAATADTTDMQHYIDKYGFFTPTQTYTIPSDEFIRLQQMLPYAVSATDKFNKRFGQSVEPELLLWWTYSEGIGAHINYSNCANEKTDYFRHITNCDRPDFWQLGYGNQFANIAILPTAFLDMHGDPNDARLVQQVGQTILTFDQTQNTYPLCGGFSCGFPEITIKNLMKDVHYTKTDHKMTTNNWWASVLSRDPSINSYMDAEGLQVSRFNYNAVKSWVGNYQGAWQLKSDQLATILANWQKLNGCTSCSNTYPLPPAPGLTYVPLQPCSQGLDSANHVTTDPKKIVTCTDIITGLGDIQLSPTNFVSRIFSILLSLSGAVALLLIIASGYQLMLSQGNPEKVKAARERLVSAIVGLIFVLFSVAFLQIIGVDILHLSGFHP